MRLLFIWLSSSWCSLVAVAVVYFFDNLQTRFPPVIRLRRSICPILESQLTSACCAANAKVPDFTLSVEQPG